MNWLIIATGILYAGGALWEMVWGNPLKAVMLASWAVGNVCFFYL